MEIGRREIILSRSAFQCRKCIHSKVTDVYGSCGGNIDSRTERDEMGRSARKREDEMIIMLK